MKPQIKRILYATDLSKNSVYAFFYAVDMAKKYKASIVILHSIEPVSFVYDEGGDDVKSVLKKAKKQEQERDIEEIKKRIQEFCNRTETKIDSSCIELVSKIIVSFGYPVEEILKTADDEGCDVIVLGTHGKGFLRETFLGRVTGSVLERSRKPVFIIPLPSGKMNIDWDKI